MLFCSTSYAKEDVVQYKLGETSNLVTDSYDFIVNKREGFDQIKSTIINDKLRVSSAIERRIDWFGDWDLIETWIFSDDGIHKSRQIFSKTPEKAMNAHDLIVGILK